MTYAATLLLCLFGVGFAAGALAESQTVIPISEAEAAFEAAAAKYAKTTSASMPNTGEHYEPTYVPPHLQPKGTAIREALPELPTKSDIYHGAGVVNDGLSLEKQPLIVSLENTPVRDVVQQVLNQLSSKTGAWTLKWRVQPENEDILEEKVNIIAETDFGNFMTYLTERIKNMTGVQLYVSVFNASRVIIVADTYY